MALRKRSKSLYEERENLELKNEKEFEDYSDNEEDEYSAEENAYSAEDDMVLVREVWNQLPKKDSIPYSERITRINWNNIHFKNQSSLQIQSRFLNIISEVRKFRILSEILKDVEKNTKSKLDLPKKPVAPYLLYLEENKSLLQSKMSKMKQKGNLVKIAAEMFSKLNNEEQQYYKDKANEIRNDYKNVISKFNLDESVLQRNVKKRKSVPQDNVFSYYFQQQNVNNKISYADAKKKFSAMNDKQKLTWILMYLGVEKKQKLNVNQYLKAKTVLSREDMSLINEYEGRPKKATTYGIFMKEFSNNTTQKSTKVFKNAAIKWKTLPDNEKEIYKQKCAEMMKRYNIELTNFINSLPEDRRTFESLHYKIKIAAGSNNRTKVNIDSYSENEELEEPTLMSPFKSPKKDFTPNITYEDQQNEENVTSSSKKKAQGKRKIIMEEDEIPSPTKSKRKYLVETHKEHEASTLNQTNKSKKRDKNLQQPHENYAQAVSNQNRKPPQKYKSPPPFLKQRPPSSLHKFFLEEIYDGVPELAKDTFKSLTRKDKNKMRRKLEKNKQKYLSELQTYAKDLPKEERRNFMESNINSNGDEDSSSWSSSDSSESD